MRRKTVAGFIEEQHHCVNMFVCCFFNFKRSNSIEVVILKIILQELNDNFYSGKSWKNKCVFRECQKLQIAV